jgi:excisionase family DNA binding protein
MSETGTTEVEERLFKAEQVAQQWGIGRSKVYELLRTGQLRSIRIGGSRRIPASAMREFLDAAS